jgi:sulfate transporter 4
VQVRDSLLLDIATGLSIGFMIVPQGMSYALLAGLPAVYGLYGSFAPVLVYALFGSSRHVAVGPTAITSLLLGHALREMYPAAKDIRDPNKPDGLESVQATFNTAAIQVRTLSLGSSVTVSKLQR